MPKALFFNLPAHGHVTPSLPLVTELVRRRHHITYFLTEKFRAKVEATGAVFRPYTAIHDDYFDRPGLDGSHPMIAAQALMITAGEILPELLDIARDEQPDYILFDGMCPWGQLVPRILGIPAVASLSLLALSPMRTMMNWDTLRALIPMMLTEMGEGRDANRRANAITRQYHIPPLGMMGIMNGLGDISISYTSSTFQPNAETVSPTIRFVGRIMDETPPDDSFSFDQVRGRRLIYVSLGSLINDNAAFFKSCIDAFTGSDDYVIISTGRGVDPASFGALPENIAIYSWVPQLDILKRASLFITHAGLGSVHDGLYFGLPLLLVPQQAEQTFTAARVVQLGAGLMLKNAQVNPETIRTKTAYLLSEPRFKNESKRIGDTFRAGGGVVRAADEIEALLQKRRGQHDRI